MSPSEFRSVDKDTNSKKPDPPSQAGSGAALYASPTASAISIPLLAGEASAESIARMLNRSEFRGDGQSSAVAVLLDTQRSHGNRFTQDVVDRVQRRSSSGATLDADTRADMESRFGRDLGDVRIHNDPGAAESSEALGANAWTRGRDIYFAAGQYAPSTREGKRLLGHELTHTIQQKAGAVISLSPRVRISSPDEPDEEEARHIGDAVADGAASRLPAVIRQSAQGAGAIQRDGKKDQHQWTKVVRITVVAGTVGEGRGTAQTADGLEFPIDIEENHLTEGSYPTSAKTMGDADWESWSRIHESSAEGPFVYLLPPHVILAPTATYEVDPRPRTVTEVWREIQGLRGDIRMIVTRLRKTGTSEPTVDDYETALGIGKKLENAGVTPDEMYDLARQVGMHIFEKDVDKFLSDRAARKSRREENIVERGKAEAGLLGKEAVYKKYRDLHARQVEAEEQEVAARAHHALNTYLVGAGFPHGIAGFERLTATYLLAFQSEAVELALDILLKYENVLDREYEQFDPVKPLNQASASAKTLAKVDTVREPAQKMYKQAHQEEENARLQYSEPWKRQAEAHMAEAEKMVTRAVPEHSIVSWQDFPREKLLGLTNAIDVRWEMAWYIDVHKAAIERARDLLKEKPSRIYELDNLMAEAYVAQDVKKDSIFDLIIRDHASHLQAEKSVREELMTIIALALSIITLGGGGLGLLASAALFGIGAAGAVSALDKYGEDTTLYMSQLISEEPSAAWAVIAILGTGMDAVAMLHAVEMVIPAAKAFNATGDLAELERALARMDARVKERVMQIADQLHEAEEGLRASKSELKAVFTESASQIKVATDPVTLVAVPLAKATVRLPALTYYFVRTRQLKSFSRFVREMESEGLFEWAKLPVERQQAVRVAFEDALKASRSGTLAYGSEIYGQLSSHMRKEFTAEAVDLIVAEERALGKTDAEIISDLEADLRSRTIFKRVSQFAKTSEEAAEAERWMAREAAGMKPDAFDAYLKKIDGVMAKHSGQLAEISDLLRASAHAADPVAYLTELEKLLSRKNVSAEALQVLGSKAVKGRVDIAWLNKIKLSDFEFDRLGRNTDTPWNDFQAAAKDPKAKIWIGKNLRGAAGELVAEQNVNKLFNSTIEDAQVEMAGKVIDFKVKDPTGVTRGLEVKSANVDQWRKSLKAYAASKTPDVVLTADQKEELDFLNRLLKQLKSAKHATHTAPYLAVTDGLTAPVKRDLENMIKTEAPGTVIGYMSETDIKATAEALRSKFGIPKAVQPE